jgi:anti-anti-sigma regulatory factor
MVELNLQPGGAHREHGGSMNPLGIHVDDGFSVLVDVRGDLCMSTVPELEACILRLIAAHSEARLTLDLRGVEFCDLTALRSVAWIRDLAREAAVELDVRESGAIERLEGLVERLAAVRAA